MNIRARKRELETACAAVVATVEQIQVDSRLGASLLYPEPAELPAVREALGPRGAMVVFGSTRGEAFALIIARSGARTVSLGSLDAVTRACRALDASQPGGVTAEAVAAVRKAVIDPLALEDTVDRLLLVISYPESVPPSPVYQIVNATTGLALTSVDTNVGTQLQLVTPDSSNVAHAQSWLLNPV